MTVAESVLAWIGDAYAIDMASLQAVAVASDQGTEVWGGVGSDGSSYAVKVSGHDPAAGLAVTAELAAAGVPGVMGPVPTAAGDWVARVGRRYLSLVPWIEGSRPLQTGMSAEQWRQFGVVLSRVHAVALPDDVAVRFTTEDWLPRRQLELLDEVDGLVGRGEAASRDDLTCSLVEAWRQAADRISALRATTESLTRRLRGQVSPKVLCHGDAHLGNVLLDEAGAVWLVDWDGARLAPREQDLMFVLGGGVLAFAPVTGTEQAWFFEGYGDVAIDDSRLQYARTGRAVEDLALWARDVLDVSGQPEDARTEALAIVHGILSSTGLLDRALEA